jgi:hypothetical protein
MPKDAGRVRQVQFTTHRMFVMTEKGKLFAFPIEITKTPLKAEERMFAS